VSDAGALAGAAGPATGWRSLPAELDEGPAPSAAIGLVTLANDTVIEPELRAFLPREGVAVYANRIPMPVDITPATLAAMEADLARTTAGIVPEMALDVVAFGCTSGSMTIGPDRVAARIREARPGIACTNPVSAGVAALRHLGCRRLALLTPYVASVNAIVERHLRAEGFDIRAAGSFELPRDTQVVRIRPRAIFDAGLALARETDAQGLFLSCTALRTSAVLARLEDALGMPVVSSNQALAWHCLRLAGCDAGVGGMGRLLAPQN
jgi:maleate isomerase